jgi:hypothetical protein
VHYRSGKCWKHYNEQLAAGVRYAPELSQTYDAVYHRERRKAVTARTWKFSPSTEYTERLQEEELMAKVMERGKILSAMMNTPPSMWRPEWTEDL